MKRKAKSGLKKEDDSDSSETEVTCASCNGEHVLDELSDLFMARKMPKGVEIKIVLEEKAHLLHIACSHGKLHLVRRLLSSGESLTDRDEFQRTPLMRACTGGNAEVIREMLIPHYTASETMPPEQAMIKNVMAQEAKDEDVIIRDNPTVNLVDEERKTALHHCAKHVTLFEPFKWLFLAGADPNAVDQSGKTPLHALCTHVNEFRNYGSEIFDNVLVLMLENGADPRIADNMGCTALHYLCECYLNVAEVIKTLIGAGADVNARTQNHITPLQLACTQLQTTNVECLIEHGADVTQANKTGWTPLHLIFKNARKRQHHRLHDLTKCLVEAGANPNAIIKSTKATPLHMACKEGVPSTCIVLMLNHGACPLYRNAKNASPVDIIASGVRETKSYALCQMAQTWLKQTARMMALAANERVGHRSPLQKVTQDKYLFKTLFEFVIQMVTYNYGTSAMFY
jgi:ankyrin repeat protein